MLTSEFYIISAKSILALFWDIISLNLLRLVLRISEFYYISFSVLIKTTGWNGEELWIKVAWKIWTKRDERLLRNEKWLLAYTFIY